MKFDKETIIAIIVCMVLLFSWPHIVKKIWPGNPRASGPSVNEKITQGIPDKVSEDPKNTENIETTESGITEKTGDKPVTVVEKPVDKPVIPVPDIKKVPSVTLENDFIVAEIDPNKGDISSIKMKKYFTTVKDGKGYKKSDENIVLLKGLPNGALRVTSGNDSWILTNVDLNVENKGTPKETIVVKRTLQTLKGKAFSITQNWSFISDYVLGSSIEVTNLSNEPLSLENVNLSSGGIPKITELAGDQVFRENFQVAYYDLVDNKIDGDDAEIGAGFIAMITGSAKNKPKQGVNITVSNKAKWIGVVNKYFTCILLPEKPFENGLLERGVVLKNNDKKEYVMAEAVAFLDFEDIAPGTSQSRNFKFYAGPKKLDLLKEFEPTSAKIMKLYIMGASFLEFISVGFLHMLNWLKEWCGSYGLSIILLTLIVKTVFWPITHRANVSMRKMQKIQPLIKELRKKYKDNPQQMNMEMMKLYKEHKVNPLGGCLPILMQMPVFFALYATFSGSIAPRHTSFLWMHDLSMPDTVAHIPWTSVPINPLMLMMTGTMVLQQKLTPSAADPAQKKMMMFMPLVMLIMLYNLPSGLTLYWTVSQFISISQLVVNKQIEKRAEMKEAGLETDYKKKI